MSRYSCDHDCDCGLDWGTGLKPIDPEKFDRFAKAATDAMVKIVAEAIRNAMAECVGAEEQRQALRL